MKRTKPLLVHRPYSPNSPSLQKGAALLVALLVVTLVAALAATLQWRQWTSVQQEQADRFALQANWLLVGAQDWARLVLREDARSQRDSVVDHLGRGWAVPLQEVKISTFLNSTGSLETLANAKAAAFQEADEVYLSGAMHDAQSKLNLTNLLEPSGTLHRPTADALLRLFILLKLTPQDYNRLMEAWVAANRYSRPDSPPRTASPTADPSPASAAILPTQFSQLSWLGLSPSTLERLGPYVTVLPEKTPVNLNTADPIVLAAVIPGLELSSAQAFASQRKSAPFNSVTAFIERLINLVPQDGLDIDLPTRLSVNTQYFEVEGQLRMGGLSTRETSLVQRKGEQVRTLWRMRSRESRLER